MKGYLLSEHAVIEMRRRGIDEETIALVLADPGQVEDVREGRVVLQSKKLFGEPAREFLVRVFVDVDRAPPVVVTAYLTSKIDKYWRSEE